MTVEVQARRLPSQCLQSKSVFQQYWNMKTLDIYREAWGQFPAAFVMTKQKKQVYLMRPQDFSSCVWWHKEVFLMGPQDFSSCVCVVTKTGILTQNKTLFLTLTKWLSCLNLPWSKVQQCHNIIQKPNKCGFKHICWIHKCKLPTLTLHLI